MITEDYVSFETAKLLKEKGFDENCAALYDLRTGEISQQGVGYVFNNSQWENFITAPTLQLAMKWLRELHNLHCDIGYHFRLGWHIKITSLKETVIDHDIEMKTYLPYYLPYKSCDYLSYEEACENAIKYCLKELI